MNQDGSSYDALFPIIEDKSRLILSYLHHLYRTNNIPSSEKFSRNPCEVDISQILADLQIFKKDVSESTIRRKVENLEERNLVYRKDKAGRTITKRSNLIGISETGKQSSDLDSILSIKFEVADSQDELSIGRYLSGIDNHRQGEHFLSIIHRVAYGKGRVEKAFLHLSRENHPLSGSALKGLAPFEDTDVDQYFGMEDKSSDLFQKIKANPLTMLVATSGSGKTSLVKAGLSARLKGTGSKKVVIDAESWHDYRREIFNLVGPSNDHLLNYEHLTFLKNVWNGKSSKEQFETILIFDGFEKLLRNLDHDKTNDFTRFLASNIRTPLFRFVVVVKDDMGSHGAAVDWKDMLNRKLVEYKEEPIAVAEMTLDIGSERLLKIIEEINKEERLVDHAALNLLRPEFKEIIDKAPRYRMVYLQIVLRKLKDGSMPVKGSVAKWITDHYTDKLRRAGFFEDDLRRRVLVDLMKNNEQFLTIQELSDNISITDHQLIGSVNAHISQLGDLGLLAIGKKGDVLAYKFAHEALISEISSLFTKEEIQIKEIKNQIKHSFSIWNNSRTDDSLMGRYLLDQLGVLRNEHLSREIWDYAWRSMARNRCLPSIAHNVDEICIDSLHDFFKEDSISLDDRRFLAKSLDDLIINMSKEHSKLLFRKVLGDKEHLDGDVMVHLLSAYAVTSYIPDVEELEFLTKIVSDDGLAADVRTIAGKMISSLGASDLISLVRSERTPPLVRIELLRAVCESDIDPNERDNIASELLIMVRADTWRGTGLRSHEMGDELVRNEVLRRFERKMADVSAHHLKNMVGQAVIAPLNKMYQNGAVETHIYLRLLGATSSSKAIPLIVKAAESYDSNELMRSELSNLLAMVNEDVKASLEEIGFVSAINEIDNDHSMDLSRFVNDWWGRIRNVQGMSSDAVFRDQMYRIIRRMIEVEKDYRNQVVNEALFALASIGGKNGTDAFISLIRHVKETTVPGHLFVMNLERVLSKLDGANCHLDPVACLSVFDIIEQDLRLDVHLTFRFLYEKRDERLAEAIWQRIGGGTSDHADGMIELFILTSPLEGLHRAVPLTNSRHCETWRVASGTMSVPWEAFTKLVGSLHDKKGDERLCILHSLISALDISTVDPIELFDLILSTDDEDIGFSLTQILSKIPQRKICDERLWVRLAMVSNDDREVIGNVLSMVLSRISSFDGTNVSEETIVKMNQTAANLLKAGDHFHGLILADALERVNHLDKPMVTSVLDDPEVWHGILHRYNDLFRLEIPLNMIRDKLVLEGVGRLISEISAENDTSWQRSMISFLCMEGFARREDYPELLRLLKKLNDGSIRQQLVDRLLELDWMRGSALFLSLAYSINDLYLLGAMIDAKDGVSDQYAKQFDLASELVDSYGSVFGKSIEPGDKAILLDPAEMVEGCFHSPKGDGPELFALLPELTLTSPLLFHMINKSLDAIARSSSGSKEQVDLLIDLFNTSERIASRHGHHACWGNLIIKTIRRIDDGEWVGYWLAGAVNGDSAIATEALIAMLDHDMDYLILESMPYTKDMVEVRLRRLPDADGKYKRKIERVLARKN
jgi:hypothetical protein